MSDYIVLVKQVPDITQITDNAFNLETGTLIRSRLASVINELDTNALAIAGRMNQLSDKPGKIIALTMGPPAAEEVLRYCLARRCDSAVLLTDKALGGADTCATANPLAFAIKKIAKELLGGSEDYYVVSGMQSVDGDTAQVPAQIAEELNMPCLPYVTDVEYKNGRFEFKGIISGGSQVISNKKVPAVITVAKYEYPLFATFAGTRLASNFKFIQWGANDINATHIGINGSKTRVISVFPPGKTTRKCRGVKDAGELAKLMVENFGKERQSGESAHDNYVLPGKRKNLFDRRFEGTKKESEDYKILADVLAKLEIKEIKQITDEVKEKIAAAASEHFHKKALEDMLAGAQVFEPAYQGQVWIAAELEGDVIHPATFELIGKARDLADSLGTQVGVVIAGNNLETKELIAAGADFVYAIEHPLLGEFDPVIYRKVFSDTIAKYWPQIVLFAATPQGRIVAPMIAYRLGCGLTADCTGLDIRDSSRKNQVAILMQTRPALGGNVMATICTKDSKCQMATARPGVMKRLAPDAKRIGKVIKEAAEISETDLSVDIIKTEKGKGKVNLGADVVVSGGKGMQSRDNYESLVNSLVESLKHKLGTSVEKGASRAAVEQGFIDRIHQVGQTGTAIGPKLYIALGISGAIQHMIGVANSDIIVAVNSDPNAPIFKHCDYYIVGTIEKVVPQISEALAKI
ncbi:MAG: electron transfer flavoprotein subunit beta [Planctomycetes bacterium GWF2_41_51]|nr:MAG: electron transfer flavoprotein subunit beta [Planctomycetes bacterium GWF2_41_51]HBG28514.1 electron transfer flavoprotein subunit beta [Phycisphaerales bacterium]